MKKIIIGVVVFIGVGIIGLIVFRKQVTSVAINQIAKSSKHQFDSTLKEGTFLDSVEEAQVGPKVQCGTIFKLPIPKDFTVTKIPEDLKDKEEVKSLCVFESKLKSQSHAMNSGDYAHKQLVESVKAVLQMIVKIEPSAFYQDLLTKLNGPSSVFEKYKAIHDSLNRPDAFDLNRNVYYTSVSNMVMLTSRLHNTPKEYQAWNGFTVVRNTESKYESRYLLIFTPDGNSYELSFQYTPEKEQEALAYLKSIMKKGMVEVNYKKLEETNKLNAEVDMSMLKEIENQINQGRR